MDNAIDPRNEFKSVNNRAFIGFTIFDVIHIVCAVILMVRAYQDSPIDAMLAAECGTEIVFSILLVAFIASLAEHNRHHETFHALYTVAWLVAVASLLVPISFLIPEFFTFTPTNGIEVALLVLELASLLLFFASMVLLFIAAMKPNKIVMWNRLIHWALIITMVGTAAQIVIDCLHPENALILVLDIIKDCAPLVPGILGFTLWTNPKFKE